MTKIMDIEPRKWIEMTAGELKKIKDVDMPGWARFVKTSHAKERHPVERDWWHIRAASMLRKIYLSGPIGVSKLRKKYTAKKNRGHKPEHVYKASGKIIRTILQQLEKAELVRFAEKGVHKGRVLTKKGKQFIDKIQNERPGRDKKKAD